MPELLTQLGHRHEAPLDVADLEVFVQRSREADLDADEPDRATARRARAGRRAARRARALLRTARCLGGGDVVSPTARRWRGHSAVARGVGSCATRRRAAAGHEPPASPVGAGQGERPLAVSNAEPVTARPYRTCDPDTQVSIMAPKVRWPADPPATDGGSSASSPPVRRVSPRPSVSPGAALAATDGAVLILGRCSSAGGCAGVAARTTLLSATSHAVERGAYPMGVVDRGV